MNPLTDIMQKAVSGMSVQTKRIGVTSENISNADTPGYKRKMVIPDAQIDPSGFREALIVLDQTAGDTAFDPTHPMADEEGYVMGSNVSLVIEMADMREANRMYEANLNAFQQARTMYKSLLDVIRR